MNAVILAVVIASVCAVVFLALLVVVLLVVLVLIILIVCSTASTSVLEYVVATLFENCRTVILGICLRHRHRM